MKSMESSWSPCKLVGECKVLSRSITLKFHFATLIKLVNRITIQIIIIKFSTEFVYTVDFLIMHNIIMHNSNNI